jgi:hypothetical protein
MLGVVVVDGRAEEAENAMRERLGRSERVSLAIGKE